MNNDDIDDSLREKWNEVLNSNNDKLASQEIDRLANLKLFEQSIINILKYRAKFYFIIGRYGQALADLTKLLEIEQNNAFALKYRGEIYYMMERYEEALVDLNKLLEINTNDIWTSKAYDEVIRK